MDNTFNEVKLAWEIRRAVEIAYKAGQRNPMFIDTSERSREMLESNFDNLDLKNWHLPFPKLAVISISSNSIVHLVARKDRPILFMIELIRNKNSLTGELIIHRTGEEPQNYMMSHQYPKQQVHISTGWTTTMLLKTVTIDNKIFKGRDSDEKLQGMAFGQIFSVVHYFYPFCVDKEMFVVESQVARKKKGKIQTTGKSTYSIMHVSKILKRFTPTGQSGQSLTKGHPRRAHPRKYRSDRWTNMRGKTIIIASTWVGPKTVLSEGRLYKVHTDVY